MKGRVNVQIVNEAPAIGKPEMMGGIRSKEEAANWAEKHGYTVVYFWLSRQRMYADKLSKQVQSKSDHLVQSAEAQ